MPLPKTALTLYGGCNCRSVRYKVEVPPFEQRSKTPYCTLGAEIPDDARIPAVYIDHCNDCRRATSSLLPTWLITPMNQVSLSCMPVKALPSMGKVEVADGKRQWRSANLLLRDDVRATVEETSLGHYLSSEKRNRWFCNYCGTPVFYSIWEDAIPADWGWPRMLDICLGTVDREYLEEDYMRPERQLWCDKGIPWVREQINDGAKLDGACIPQHPLTKIDKFVEDDASGHQKEVQKEQNTG